MGEVGTVGRVREIRGAEHGDQANTGDPSTIHHQVSNKCINSRWPTEFARLTAHCPLA
jgi:hypothetical protein